MPGVGFGAGIERLVNALEGAPDPEEEGIDVFYVAPLRAIEVRKIAEISRLNGIKTITGVPEYVSDGLGVGIGLLKQRPLIIINLKAARAEGSEFRSQLLKLSRVIEDGGAMYAGAAFE